MARIELKHIAHRYPGQTGFALAPLELVWRDGGAYALLGPSGCGKTTLLNIISGLLRPSEGAVRFDGKDVTALPPEVRNIAQVFQFPVIYDTMSVFDNLAFPLRNRGLDERTTRARVEQVAELLELGRELKKRASGLSAELKQRISLGRGLVRKDVGAILLDEPLTVIDPHVKWLLRRKLMQIHAELRVTLIYVTHDQTEALTLADEVLVMNEGRVLQQATPEELFERPAHTFVGYFIGSPGMNLLPCTFADGALHVAGQRLVVAEELATRARESSGELTLGVRPEFVRVHDVDAGASERCLRAVIDEVEDLGPSRTLFARLAPSSAPRIAAKLKDDGPVPKPGDSCYLELSPEHTILYADGRALA